MCLVRCVPGTNKTAQDVIQFLEAKDVERGKIVRWMLPDYVVFCDEIPKTSVGKYDKVAIKKRLNEFIGKAQRVHKN